MAQTVTPGCYTREYSASHLAKNPNQTVAEIVVELYDEPPEQGFQGSAIVRARMADTASTRAAGTLGRWYDNWLFCEFADAQWAAEKDWVQAGALTCLAECDGGFFQVLRQTGDELLIRTEYVALPGDGCGEGEIGALGDDGARHTTYKLFSASPKRLCAMRIACPLCGERDRREFYYVGDAKALNRPDPEAGAAAWDDYVHLRDNPAGITKDLWYHEMGCSAWLVVERNTLTHEVLGAELAEKVKR